MNVPKLRFKEFSEEWELNKLKDICLKIKDGTHFSPKTFENGEYKYLTSKNIKNGYLTRILLKPMLHRFESLAYFHDKSGKHTNLHKCQLNSPQYFSLYLSPNYTFPLVS